MERIIDGTLYRGQTVPDAWVVRVWEANGHREISARNAVTWEEVGPCCAPLSWDDYIAQSLDDDERKTREAMRDADEAEKRDANLRRAARRAKSMCRRVIKTEAFDELLTITYRHNQTDVSLFKAHFKEWVRRMRRALGGQFRYCAGFEPQERGAWHAHVAVHKLPKHAQFEGLKVQGWRLGTEVWRSIVGRDNGLVFVGGKDKYGRPRKARMSVAKMAGYVSKYITKHYELVPDEKNRYSRSDGIVVGKPYTMTFTGLPGGVWAVLHLAFQCDDAHVVVSHRVDPDHGSYWLVTEPQRPSARDNQYASVHAES